MTPDTKLYKIDHIAEKASEYAIGDEIYAILKMKAQHFNVIEVTGMKRGKVYIGSDRVLASTSSLFMNDVNNGTTFVVQLERSDGFYYWEIVSARNRDCRMINGVYVFI